jgi:spore coat polysaccharide biosynthesis predicted glycosyltransferase SpsG
VASIALRADGGSRRGFGHVRRVVTLAEAIAARGDRACVIVNREVAQSTPTAPGIAISVVDDGEIETLAGTVAHLATCRADVLVVDSYDVSPDTLRGVPIPVAMILDAPPPVLLPAAILVNAAAADTNHAWPVAADTQLLLGTRYALLRQEFMETRRSATRNAVTRVLVTTGGSDVDGWIVRLTTIATTALPKATIDVVVGPCFSSSALNALSDLAASRGVVLHLQPRDMCNLMLAADVALTGGGQTLFELAATGTPVVTVRLADNQRDNITSLSSAGALVHAGDAGDTTIDQRLAHMLEALAHDPTRRERMSRAGQVAVDGRGAMRVAQSLGQLAAVHYAQF